MIALTRPGAGFAGLSVLLYLASMQSTSGLLFLVLGVVFGCFAFNAAEARRSVVGLSVAPPDSPTATEGERLSGRWTVTNATKHALGLVEVKAPCGTLLRTGLVAGGKTICATSQLVLRVRGVYPYRGLRLSSAYPFGLVRSQRRVEVTGEILVHPAVYECEPPRVAGFEPTLGGQFTGASKSAAGDRFHGVRPMEDRDPMKLIHWPSSSKGQGMMVKEFDEELSGRVSLLVDCSAARTPDGDSTLDWAARAAGSLALAALEQGNQVELADLGAGTVLSVSPFADVDVLLSALARLKERPGPVPLTEVQELLERLPRRSGLCFVLTRPDQERIGFIENDPLCAGRTVSVCVPDFAEPLDWPAHADLRRYSAHALSRARE